MIYFDLFQARAIFRWVTVKNLNSIMFEEEKGDTPMALLRGIKFGTESYHVLFKRLCRCIVNRTILGCVNSSSRKRNHAT